MESNLGGILFQRTRVKWKMNPYKRDVLRGDGAGKLRIVLPKTRKSAVEPRVRPSTTPPPSVSLIITACVPAKITPFIHPRRVLAALARSTNPSLLSSSIHLSSILRRAMRSLRSISSSSGIVCLRNFTDALCTTACREIIICNNTRGWKSSANRIKVCSTYIVGNFSRNVIKNKRLEK